MNRYTLAQLRNVSDELSFLAGTFQLKPLYLRAKQIRQADKTLASVEALFSSILALESKQWKEAADGLAVLRKKLLLLDENEKLVLDLGQKTEGLKEKLKIWSSLPEEERKLIMQIAARTQKFTETLDEKAEASLLHRYERFSALKELLPYTDNIDHICESIFHYENKKKYESNVAILTQNIEKLKERTGTIHKGFWFALVLCLLVVTIPICVPFAFSLWRKKSQIKEQIQKQEEMLQRERARLLGSQEGAVAAQKIKKTLGELSLDQVKATLHEIKELQKEFQGQTVQPYAIATLLKAMDDHKSQMESLFGDVPADPMRAFRWLSENVSRLQEIDQMIAQLSAKKEDALLKQKQLTKGYSAEMLKKSMQKLQSVVSTTMNVPFELENKMFFADLASQIPELLVKMRECLYLLSKGQSVDLNQWNLLKLKIQGFANMMSLCVLDAEIVSQFQEEESNQTKGSEKNDSSRDHIQQADHADFHGGEHVVLGGVSQSTASNRPHEQSDI